MESESKRPTIATVLPHYNHAHHLSGIFDCILSQSVPFDQVIVVDDASTDGGQNILKKYADEHPSIELVLLKTNGGVVEALNEGYRRVHCDYIFPLSCDDIFSKQVVEQGLKALAQFPEAKMIVANSATLAANGTDEKKHTLPFAPGLSLNIQDIVEMGSQRVFTFFGGGCMMHRQSVIDLGVHDSAFEWYADWLLYMMMALRHPIATTNHQWVRVRDDEARYSAQTNDWERQRPVLDRMLLRLKTNYPQEYQHFKHMALLPDYQPRILWWLAFNSQHRDFLTGLLVWRMLIFSTARACKPYVPSRLVDWLRRITKA